MGDIAKITGIDATVDMANLSLLGRGRADGVIRRAAGKGLLHECRLLGDCKTGQAKITEAYSLECRYIIYTVGSMWNSGTRGEQEKLASCYRNSLLLALENGAKRTVFPSVSIDIYHFPVGLATETAMGTARGFTAEHPGELGQILWILFDARTELVYDTISRKL